MAATRIELENTELVTYVNYVLRGRGRASGEELIRLIDETGSATYIFDLPAVGYYQVRTRLFDQSGGAAVVSVTLDGEELAQYILDRENRNFRGANIANSLFLTGGEAFVFNGTRVGDDQAEIDYIEFIPQTTGIISFETESVSAVETDGSLELKILRTSGADGDIDVTVNFASSSGTTQFQTTFVDGQTEETIFIPLFDNDVFTGDQAFSLTLTSESFPEFIGPVNAATLTIIDDEEEPVPPPPDDDVPDDAPPDDDVPGDAAPDDDVPGDAAPGDAPPGDDVPDDVPGDDAPDDAPGDDAPDDAPGDDAPSGDASDGSAGDDGTPDGDAPDAGAGGGDVSDGGMDGNGAPDGDAGSGAPPPSDPPVTEPPAPIVSDAVDERIIIIRGTPLPDVLQGNDNDNIITGLDSNDALYGQMGDDSVNGDSGRDAIFGNQGNDILNGGKAKDFIDGGSGSDRILGEQGGDSLLGGTGNDTIEGGNGADKLIGGRGNDLLVGDRGSDLIRGNKGDDIMLGGAGRDTLKGGAGRDVYVLEIANQFDTFRGFRVGRDQLGLSDDLTFADLTIVDSANGAIVRANGSKVAVVDNVRANQLTEDLFVAVSDIG